MTSLPGATPSAEPTFAEKVECARKNYAAVGSKAFVTRSDIIGALWGAGLTVLDLLDFCVQSTRSATHERLDRSKAVNLARNIRETDNIEDITRKGILTLVDGVLRMDAELTRLYRAQSASELPKQERHCSMCLRNTSRWPCNATHCPLRDNGPAASERALGHDQHSGSSCAAERMDANEGSTPSGSALCTRSANAATTASELLEAVRGWVHARAFSNHTDLLKAEYRLNETFRKVVGLSHELGDTADRGNKNG